MALAQRAIITPERRALQVVRGLPEAIRNWKPATLLGFAIAKVRPFVTDELWAEIIERIQSAMVVESELRIVVKRNWGLYLAGLIPLEEVAIEDWGTVSRKVITDVGVGFIVDAFENTVELETMKYHGLGTGVGAEAAGDTALGTELTTEYNPNSTRATGTTAETSANIYQTVATNTLDSGTPAVTEHGIFSAASSGVLLDRSKFSAINLVGANGDAITSTYLATFTSGG